MTVASYNGSYAMTPGGYFVHPPLPNSALKWSAMNESAFSNSTTLNTNSFVPDEKLDKYLVLKFDGKYASSSTAANIIYPGFMQSAFGSIYQRNDGTTSGVSISYFNTMDNALKNSAVFNGTYMYNTSSPGILLDAYVQSANSAEYNTFKLVREVFPASAKYSAFLNDELRVSGVIPKQLMNPINLSIAVNPVYASGVYLKNMQLATFRNEQLAAEW